MVPTTRTTVLVLRLWAEEHDAEVRGWLLGGRAPDGDLAVGFDDILAAVAAEITAFGRDADATRA